MLSGQKKPPRGGASPPDDEDLDVRSDAAVLKGDAKPDLRPEKDEERVKLEKEEEADMRDAGGTMVREVTEDSNGRHATVRRLENKTPPHPAPVAEEKKPS